MGGKAFLLGVAVAAAFSGAVGAEPKYDVNLERAVMEIVSRKIGDIRPGFGYDQVPQIVSHAAQAVAGAPIPASQFLSAEADPMTLSKQSEYLLDLRPTMEELRPMSANTVSRVIYH